MPNLTPGQPDNAPSNQAFRRTVFRVLGALVLLVASGFLLVAAMDLFGAASAEPVRFWLLFVGIPLLVVGAVLVQLGFGGVGARYVAAEYVPILREAMNSLGRPTPGQVCRPCGRRNVADARFCTGCDSALSA